MPVEQRNGAQRNGLDRRQFHEILQRFSADTAEDVDAAICDAFKFCDRLRMPFCDVARNVYGQDDRVTELQKDLAELIKRDDEQKAERSNLEAKRADMRANCSTLRSENERLGQGADYCRRCERLREAISIIAGIALFASWLRWLPGHGLQPWPVGLCGVSLSLAPLAFTLSQWHWLLFKRKVKWISARDNELTRWWKGLS